MQAAVESCILVCFTNALHTRAYCSLSITATHSNVYMQHFILQATALTENIRKHPLHLVQRTSDVRIVTNNLNHKVD